VETESIEGFLCEGAAGIEGGNRRGEIAPHSDWEGEGLGAAEGKGGASSRRAAFHDSLSMTKKT